MGIPPEIIDTPRLRLRKPQSKDSDAIFRHYAQDEHIVTYLAWHPHQSHDQTSEFVKSRIAEWATGPRYSWTIVHHNGHEVLGMMSIRVLQPFRISMSYVIKQDSWGQGYGTEAARAIIKWANSVPEIFRVEACSDLDNLRSARVLEKLGMTREGVLRRTGYTPNISNEPRDCFCYSITK
jgi:[ribosomal protein S5]-alanine N-acetyltransferase